MLPNEAGYLGATDVEPPVMEDMRDVVTALNASILMVSIPNIPDELTNAQGPQTFRPIEPSLIAAPADAETLAVK